MKPYKSRSGKASGVTAYLAGTDHITLQFGTGDVYTYSYRSAGKKAVDTMKMLAEASEGLSTFIAQHQPGYEK